MLPSRLLFFLKVSTRPVPRIIRPILRKSYSECDNMAKDKTSKNVAAKTVKGMRDWDTAGGIRTREKVFDTIKDVLQRAGAVELDTPVMELSATLKSKYGEDSKLIYDLADQGGEQSSLRYDLTVPFARYLATNPTINNISRYQYGKVYRRDQPAMTKGRLREFYQFDYDIAGTDDPTIADAEVINAANEVFTALGWENYTIKINNRKILDGIFEVCGVPDDKIRPISSAVDKLDKLPWGDVRKEMVEEKGLAEDVADKIGGYVLRKGKNDLIDILKADTDLMANTRMKEGVADMESLFVLLGAFEAMDKISFDLSLARGLDYYTGVIYEIVTDGSSGDATARKPSRKRAKEGADEDEDRSSDPSVGVGSVAAGGRYDNLVGQFGKKQIPCVGVSFGVDRIIAITMMRDAADKTKAARDSKVDVFVMAFGGKGFTGLMPERAKIVKTLRRAGIYTSFSRKEKPKLDKQFAAADEEGIPFSVIIGEDEMAQGKVKIKENGLPEGNPEKSGVLVDLSDLVPEIKRRLERKAKIDGMTTQGLGLRVVGGIRGENKSEATEVTVPIEKAPEAEATEVVAEPAVKAIKAEEPAKVQES